MKSGIIYKGPSLLDGQPIVVVATYSNRNAAFAGHVIQTYIILDKVNPLEASKTGQDRSICGDCIFRGTPTTDPKRKIAKGRRCYVNLGQGVLMVHKALERGIYPVVAPRDIGRGRFVRIGAYGDPGAVPDEVWDELISESTGWNAYSHQSGWRPDIAMQSADDYHTAKMHWIAGRRTYRVIADLGHIDYNNEVLCPKSKEAGKRAKCDECRLCAGSKQAKSVAIVEH